MNEDIFHLGIKVLIKNKKSQILVLKVNINLLKKVKGWNGEEYWDIPGGRIKKGDTIEETLKREVVEEIGVSKIYSIKPVEMLLSNIRIPVESNDVGLILSIYSCEIGEDQKIILSKENTEYRWVEPKEAAKLLSFKYPKEFCEKIKNC